MRVSKLIILVISLCVDAKIRVYVTDSPIQQFDRRIYKKELLTDQYQGPKELAYDSSSRQLYFMYMDDDIQNSGRATINVITKHSMKIKGIERNKATAVDPETSDVYFGTENGLYKYDALTNEATSIGLYNVNIMKLVVRNNAMYMLDGNNHKIYKIFNEGNGLVKVGDWSTVMEFDVDNDRNIHFVTMCGLYCAVNGHETVKNTDLSVVYHFIVDNDKTLGVTEDGLYEINCRNGTANRIANIDFFPTSIIFGDYGDVYYTLDNSIFRLTPISSYLIYVLHRNSTEHN